MTTDQPTTEEIPMSPLTDQQLDDTTPQREPCWRCGSPESRIAERTENLHLIRCRECDAYLGNEEHAEGEAMRLFRAEVAMHLKTGAEETHVVADDSDDPEHVDDCPGCAPVSA